MLLGSYQSPSNKNSSRSVLSSTKGISVTVCAFMHVLIPSLSFAHPAGLGYPHRYLHRGTMDLDLDPPVPIPGTPAGRPYPCSSLHTGFTPGTKNGQSASQKHSHRCHKSKLKLCWTYNASRCIAGPSWKQPIWGHQDQWRGSRNKLRGSQLISKTTLVLTDMHKHI